MLNKVILMGRLTRNPECKYVNDKKVCNFTLAIDRPKQSNGEKQTDFLNCFCWGKRAEFVQQWFTKGMMAVVVGRVQSRNWEDQNGNKRSTVEINADEISFGETKKSREAMGNLPPEPYPNAPDDQFTALDDAGEDVPF